MLEEPMSQSISLLFNCPVNAGHARLANDVLPRGEYYLAVLRFLAGHFEGLTPIVLMPWRLNRDA
jgi:hypothetical protein